MWFEKQEATGNTEHCLWKNEDLPPVWILHWQLAGYSWVLIPWSQQEACNHPYQLLGLWHGYLHFQSGSSALTNAATIWSWSLSSQQEKQAFRPAGIRKSTLGARQVETEGNKRVLDFNQSWRREKICFSLKVMAAMSVKYAVLKSCISSLHPISFPVVLFSLWQG